MTTMRVHLGCDHAGFEFKEVLKTWLKEAGHEPIDHGALEYDADDDYPEFCIRAAEGVVADQARGIQSLGVVIGGSGNGEQIAANKVAGARAALAWSVETAKLARNHNNANLIGIGARMHDTAKALQIVDAFLNAAFAVAQDAIRHQRRIDAISAYEVSGEV
ncbi:MAG: ribose/galactose isomerase RpiB [Actinomycetota bacterium]|jgi:ribose 5-phosphate isomerase B